MVDATEAPGFAPAGRKNLLFAPGLALLAVAWMLPLQLHLLGGFFLDLLLLGLAWEILVLALAAPFAARWLKVPSRSVLHAGALVGAVHLAIVLQMVLEYSSGPPGTENHLAMGDRAILAVIFGSAFFALGLGLGAVGSLVAGALGGDRGSLRVAGWTAVLVSPFLLYVGGFFLLQGLPLALFAALPAVLAFLGAWAIWKARRGQPAAA